MPIEVKLPELGENLEGGEVLEIRTPAGQSVTEGQTLLEIEAEKSTIEVPAPASGQITKYLVNKGDQIKVGQTICLIEGAQVQKNGPQAARSDQPPAAPAPEPKPAAK